jgi:hypothetical protein
MAASRGELFSYRSVGVAAVEQALLRASISSSYSSSSGLLLSHSLLNELLAALNGAERGFFNQGSQPFTPGVPPAGVPSPQGSSSGSSSSSGGFGFLAVLALLSLLLLSGKFLWTSREFLKPTSALLPIIERPG